MNTRKRAALVGTASTLKAMQMSQPASRRLKIHAMEVGKEQTYTSVRLLGDSGVIRHYQATRYFRCIGLRRESWRI